jgi:hypothetical protein
MSIGVIALKRTKYGGRSYKAGEEFNVKTKQDAKLLQALRLVEPYDYAPETYSRRDMRAEDITAVRVEYETVVGKRPFHGWDAATLRQKMAAHVAIAEPAPPPVVASAAETETETPEDAA